VKICGITSRIGAEWAVNTGADALGFVFVPASRRYVRPSGVREICRRLPPFVARVGVFKDNSPEEVAEIAEVAGLTAIQLHGDEDPADYASIGLPIIKSVSLPVDDRGLLIDSEEPAPESCLLRGDRLTAVQAVLLDSYYGGQAGGTGRPLPWKHPRVQKLRAICREKGIPFILAGGLTPENVQAGIQALEPYAVDVSSGVEEGGQKAEALIKSFIGKARGGEIRAGGHL